VSVNPDIEDSDDEDICGFTFDHDEEVDYEGPEWTQWHCRRCGAEGWTEPEGEED
jgi:hypothetical protein